NTDNNFTPTSQHGFDLKGSEFLTSTAVTENNNLLLSGYKADEKTGKTSYVAIEVNNDGEITWEKELSTSGDDLLRKTVITRDGGLVFAGNSTGKSAQYKTRSEEHTSELQSRENLVCRLLL